MPPASCLLPPSRRSRNQNKMHTICSTTTKMNEPLRDTAKRRRRRHFRFIKKYNTKKKVIFFCIILFDVVAESEFKEK